MPDLPCLVIFFNEDPQMWYDIVWGSAKATCPSLEKIEKMGTNQSAAERDLHLIVKSEKKTIWNEKWVIATLLHLYLTIVHYTKKSSDCVESLHTIVNSFVYFNTQKSAFGSQLVV